MSSLRSNLFLVALGLSMLGLVMVYSATYSEVGTDFLFVRIGHMVLGVAVFFLASRVRYTAWRRYAPALYLIVLVGLVLVLVPGIGTQINGARRWLDLGPMSLQPAEFAKLAAILTLSCAVARLPHGSGLPVKPLLAVGVLFVLVFLEPDFGTSVVLLAGVAGTLWASELRTRDLVLSGLLGLVAVAGMMVLEPYRRERFLTFLDPWAAADGSGYQVVQSMVAIKAGGFFGSGAGSGGQGPYVPELGTDMIFALIGEELGLIGMVVVIAAFGFIALAGRPEPRQAVRGAAGREGHDEAEGAWRLRASGERQHERGGEEGASRGHSRSPQMARSEKPSAAKSPARSGASPALKNSSSCGGGAALVPLSMACAWPRWWMSCWKRCSKSRSIRSCWTRSPRCTATMRERPAASSDSTTAMSRRSTSPCAVRSAATSAQGSGSAQAAGPSVPPSMAST